MSQANKLPARPNLIYLKKLAKEKLVLLRADRPEAKLAEAQLIVAREHGFPSWRKLKVHVETEALQAALKEIDADTLQRFFDAIRGGDEAAVSQALDRHPALANARHPDGHTALAAAAEFNHAGIVTLLMKAGADPQQKYGQSAHTPLSWALTVNSFQAADALLRAGVKPDFFCAAGLGEADAVKSFFSKDGKLKNNSSQTGSSRFAADGSRLPRPPETAREIISDALYIACRNGRTEVVKFLLQQNPDLAFRAYMGGTPLHWAYFNGSPQVIQLLLDAGADPSARDDVFQCTPRAFGICVPVSWGIKHRVRESLERDPLLVNILDGRGTPLHEAARTGDVEMIGLLIDAGGDVSLVDGDGKKPVEIALEKNHAAAAELLRIG
jgi:ankyrin repeat protein